MATFIAKIIVTGERCQQTTLLLGLLRRQRLRRGAFEYQLLPQAVALRSSQIRRASTLVLRLNHDFGMRT